MRKHVSKFTPCQSFKVGKAEKVLVKGGLFFEVLHLYWGQRHNQKNSLAFTFSRVPLMWLEILESFQNFNLRLQFQTFPKHERTMRGREKKKT